MAKTAHWQWAKTVPGEHGGLYYRCPKCHSLWSCATNQVNRFKCCPKCGKALQKPLNEANPIYVDALSGARKNTEETNPGGKDLC